MKEIIFFGYIALISTIGVILCVYDKIASKHRGARRIREVTLCTLGLLGGALCMLLTMLWIRHKTKHTAIMVIMSTATVLWFLVYAVLFGILVITV